MLFGSYVRKAREALYEQDRAFSIRKLADRLGVHFTYLARVEREETVPTEEFILNLAKELREDPDLLLAMVGKVSTELQAVILRHPKAFAGLLRQLKEAPAEEVVRVTQAVRDGDW